MRRGDSGGGKKVGGRGKEGERNREEGVEREKGERRKKGKEKPAKFMLFSSCPSSISSLHNSHAF